MILLQNKKFTSGTSVNKDLETEKFHIGEDG